MISSLRRVWKVLNDDRRYIMHVRGRRHVSGKFPRLLVIVVLLEQCDKTRLWSSCSSEKSVHPQAERLYTLLSRTTK